MPEGPEVKVITDQLRTKLVGQTIIAGQPFGRYLKQPVEGWNEIRWPLPIEEIQCKGKFIYWQLGSDWYLWNTLGMTGSWNFPPPGEKDNNVAFIFHLQKDNEVHFNDIRHFGTLKFVSGKQQLHNKLATLGPDILDGKISAPYFSRVCNKQGQKTIAEILMNQKLIAGIGNYIKSEALYRAKISPWRRGTELTSTEIVELLQQINWVATTSYQAGGTTIATYTDTTGQTGKFSSLLQVYGKKTDPLGNTVRHEETPDKRTSWWVPGLQS